MVVIDLLFYHMVQLSFIRTFMNIGIFYKKIIWSGCYGA